MCDLLDLAGAWFAETVTRVICVNRLGIGLLYRNAGSGRLLDRVGWGFVELDPLVSPDLDSGSLELVDCMADPRKTYGEMARLWGSAKTYGEMRQACGCMGKPRYRMGRWPVYGMPLNRMGGRENVWESGAGIWGKSRGCVGTADMEGSI